mgnify:CR=1 FL=1
MGRVRMGGEWRVCLNALSGIGGVRTLLRKLVPWRTGFTVLMPCRALEAFGQMPSSRQGSSRRTCVLMPCRALEAFGHKSAHSQGDS